MITQRVTIDELEVGMYVEAVLKQTGSLRVKTQGRVHSQRVIQQLKLQGILELTISDQGNLLTAKTTDEQTSATAANSDPYSNKAEAPDDPTERSVDFQDEIDQATILGMLERERHDKLESETTVKPPPTFELVNWVKWNLMFTNYMMSIKGVTEVPLYYVGRKDKTADKIEEMDDLD